MNFESKVSFTLLVKFSSFSLSGYMSLLMSLSCYVMLSSGRRTMVTVRYSILQFSLNITCDTMSVGDYKLYTILPYTSYPGTG